MHTTLMLDLEGVLITTNLGYPKHVPRETWRPLMEGRSTFPPGESLKEPYVQEDMFGIRPYAQEFLEQVVDCCDEVYLNTCVREKRALELIQDLFNMHEIQYHDWNRMSPYGKAGLYDTFTDTTIIHVEDGSVNNKEARHTLELGHHYISIEPWIAYKPGNNDPNEKGLSIALSIIQDIASGKQYDKHERGHEVLWTYYS